MRKELVVVESPKSPEAEMFKNLRTNIQFMNAEEKKVMLITSTSPGEGKSYVSANLASAFSQIDKRVLLIDTDMRKGRQYSIFNVRPRPGLSNYLSGVVDQDFYGDKDDIENYIQETSINNLYVLVAGSVPPNPSELLVSAKMEKMLQDLKQTFDVIILDAPPALIVADALVIARYVDFAMIVVAQNVTKIEDLEKAKASLENIGGKVVGTILNKVQMSGKTYEHTYYYGDRVSAGKKPKQRR